MTTPITPVPPAPPVRPRRPLGLIVLVSVLAALLTGTLCLAGAVRFLGPGPKTISAADSWPYGETRRAVKAARDCVSHFFDIDQATAASDIEQVLECATGDFRDEFDSGKAELENAVEENDVQSRPRILAAAVTRTDRGSVTVLVAADARVKNASSPKGRTVHYRVQVEMSRVAGEWRVAELRFVG